MEKTGLYCAESGMLGSEATSHTAGGGHTGEVVCRFKFGHPIGCPTRSSGNEIFYLLIFSQLVPILEHVGFVDPGCLVSGAVFIFSWRRSRILVL